MADVLVRDAPEEVVAALDAQAARLGISRTEYLRRRLAEAAAQAAGSVTVEDLRATAEFFRDAQNPDVIREAWR
jgi:Ribbon-helix-helix protein, copG family